MRTDIYECPDTLVSLLNRIKKINKKLQEHYEPDSPLIDIMLRLSFELLDLKYKQYQKK